MHVLVTATAATILWLSYQKLIKACMGEWKVRQNNRTPSCAETFEHKYALWTPQNNQCVGEMRREAASCLVTPWRAVFPWGSHVLGVLPVLAAAQPWVLLLCLGAVRTDCSWEHRLYAGYASAGDWEGRDASISFFLFLIQPGWDSSCYSDSTRCDSHFYLGLNVKVAFISVDCRTGSAR